MTTVDAVIFDADHTLYTPESDRAYKQKFAFLAERTGLDQDKIRRKWEKNIERVKQTSDPGEGERRYLIERTLKNLGAPHDDELIDDAYYAFWEVVTTDMTSPDGLVAVLRKLRNDGVRMAIATDEFPEALRIKLQTVFTEDFVEETFEEIVTPRDTGTRKPSESFYTPIIDTFDTFPENTVVVGDSWERDLKPAQDLGTHTVLVANEKTGSPDYCIDDVTAVEAVVERIQDE